MLLVEVVVSLPMLPVVLNQRVMPSETVNVDVVWLQNNHPQRLGFRGSVGTLRYAHDERRTIP